MPIRQTTLPEERLAQLKFAHQYFISSAGYILRGSTWKILSVFSVKKSLYSQITVKKKLKRVCITKLLKEYFPENKGILAEKTINHTSIVKLYQPRGKSFTEYDNPKHKKLK